jgi:hypothetical protein
MGVLHLLACAAFADSYAPPVGFRFCSPPFRPPCIDAADTFASDDVARRCKNDVSRFSVEIVRYRACLLEESFRALADANKIMERFDCKVAPKPQCRPQGPTMPAGARPAQPKGKSAP